MKRIRIISLVLVCALLAGCGIVQNPAPTALATTQPAVTEAPTPIPTETPTQAPTEAPTPTPESTPTPEPAEVSIMAVGDIMFHWQIINSVYNKSDKSYNFDYNFQHIKETLSSADVAIGNFECTLGGPDKPYSLDGGKIFSAPDAAADALKNAGFDILTCANNHITNKGTDGLKRTATVFREKGIVPIGIRASTDEPFYYVAETKGIKIGYMAYTFGSGKDTYFSSFSSSKLQSELDRMSKTIEDMRAQGAEIIVFFMHWGTEHQRNPNGTQKKVAQGLADIGVDVVFGSHPHTLQSVDVLTSAKTGKKALIVYSLGNFISNQRSEFNAAWTYSEDCMIIKVTVTKPVGGEAAVSKFEYLPTWTLYYKNKNGHRNYTVIPLEKALQTPADYELTTEGLIKEAKKSMNSTDTLMKDAVDEGIITKTAN